MIQKITELTEPPEIGRYYLVECVMVPGKGWMPVSGPLHNDPEVQIERKHYHPDPRFMPLTYTGLLHLARGGMDDEAYLMADEAELGVVFFERPDNEYPYDGLQFDPPVWKRRKCRRQMPIFPNQLPSAKFLTVKLESIYLGRNVKCGLCPHKKIPIGSLPKDENGTVVCNGHGLRICTKTNKVIER